VSISSAIGYSGASEVTGDGAGDTAAGGILEMHAALALCGLEAAAATIKAKRAVPAGNTRRRRLIKTTALLSRASIFHSVTSRSMHYNDVV